MKPVAAVSCAALFLFAAAFAARSRGPVISVPAPPGPAPVEGIVEDAPARPEAPRRIARQSDPAALASCLGLDDPELKASAIAALGKRMSLTLLDAVYRAEKDPDLRAEAVAAVRRNRVPHAESWLQWVSLHDPSALVREEAELSLVDVR